MAFGGADPALGASSLPSVILSKSLGPPKLGWCHQKVTEHVDRATLLGTMGISCSSLCCLHVLYLVQYGE